MKNRFLTTVLTAFMLVAAPAGGYAQANRTHVLSSDKSSLVVTTNDGGTAYYQYFGPRISSDDISGLFGVNANFTGNTLPTFGPDPNGEKALSVEMPDGNMSLDLKMDSLRRTTDGKGELLILTFTDRVYPLTVRQYFRHYAGTEVFSTWYDITNNAKKGAVKLITFASASVPFTRSNNYLTQFHGGWGSESYMTEEKLPDGQTVIADKAGLRNAFGSNPGFMISIDGKPAENAGEVFGCNLLWSGNYKTRIEASANRLNVISGINDDTSLYSLVPGETFSTPEFVMTFSKEGKGGVSRAFHKWARLYAIANGDKLRDVLLNSWEGVYFNVNQETMDQMMGDIASLGGELFVMDDGWFGDKYPRDNDKSSLGDWMVCEKKLPQGIGGLTQSARRNGIKFGIWIEPEMANTKSELYEKHPDWVLQHTNRPLRQGRGGTQVVLDLCNPKVQDFVFGVTDKLLSENPEIAYIKWDCNADIMNYGSLYLPKDKQSELYVRYHRGLHKVLDRIRAKYPDVTIQLCASGGGRVGYGLLPWFDEFWTSDNTDAYQRLFIQWSDSHFYPAIAMASHVSASPNHQTGREVPIKFRFDVAMSGRLGMEIQPKNMSDREKEFSKRAIEAYKSVRPVIQLGDQYRLISPYDKGAMAALMYADETKDHAVLFVYRTDYLNGQAMPKVRLDGVDENKNYRIKDLTPLNPSKPSNLNGKVVSGRVLKYAGLNVSGSLSRPWTSLTLKLTAE
ncbi:alpha-galactosidase AgaA [Bacteroidaceae bacterium]|nr:alpha-galactosidase AgaA [Bacteroidaceae bacterium]